MKLLIIAYSAIFILALTQHAGAQDTPVTDTSQQSSTVGEWVQHQGRLSIVHRQGDASPTVNLSDIIDSIGFWAIGPLAGLRGEITVIDGKPFVARVISDTVVISHETDIEAPFLVYGIVDRWQEKSIPDSIRTILQLEQWLAVIADSIGMSGAPNVFPFKVVSSQSEIDFHVISNQEPGYLISGPHHELMRFFTLESQPLTLLGVFSKHHAGVFTHHDQWTHIHLVSDDKRHSGHVDSLSLGSDAVLFLPEAK